MWRGGCRIALPKYIVYLLLLSVVFCKNALAPRSVDHSASGIIAMQFVLLLLLLLGVGMLVEVVHTQIAYIIVADVARWTAEGLAVWLLLLLRLLWGWGDALA